MNGIKFNKKYDDPLNLSELEQRRWNAHLRHQFIIEKLWKPMFNKMRKVHKFYGYDKKGYRFYFIVEDGLRHECFDGPITGYIKARMLEEEELPLYINETSEELITFVKKRLTGEIKKFPRRDDLVQEYFKNESMIVHCHHFKELTLEILKKYVCELERYLTKKDDLKYSYPKIVLKINNRIYIWQKDNFIVRPDDIQYCFSPEEIIKINIKLDRQNI